MPTQPGTNTPSFLSLTRYFTRSSSSIISSMDAAVASRPDSGIWGHPFTGRAPSGLRPRASCSLYRHSTLNLLLLSCQLAPPVDRFGRRRSLSRCMRCCSWYWPSSSRSVPMTWTHSLIPMSRPRIARLLVFVVLLRFRIMSPRTLLPRSRVVTLCPLSSPCYVTYLGFHFRVLWVQNPM